MTDYSNGKIYIISSIHTDDVYIGSTVQTLKARMKQHINDFKTWVKSDYTAKYISVFEVVMYGDYEIELLENYPCETKRELLTREGYHQKQIQCVNVNVAGRTLAEYYRDNIEYFKDYYQDHKEKIKQYYQDNKEQKKAYQRKRYAEIKSN